MEPMKPPKFCLDFNDFFFAVTKEDLLWNSTVMDQRIKPTNEVWNSTNVTFCDLPTFSCYGSNKQLSRFTRAGANRFTKG